MGLLRRKFTREFKEAAAGRLELRGFGAKAFTGPGRSRADENRVVALERKAGQQAVESVK